MSSVRKGHASFLCCEDSPEQSDPAARDEPHRGSETPVPPVSSSVFRPVDEGAAARWTPFAVPSGAGEGGGIDAAGRVPDGKVRSRRRKPSRRISEYNTPSPIKRPWLIPKQTTSRYVAAKESNPDRRNGQSIRS